jgi:hypothetical protein
MSENKPPDVKHGNTGCRLCGKKLAYTGAVYCGAACCAAWEMGQRPALAPADPKK